MLYLKSVLQLNLGFSDAQNYTQQKNKQMLNDVFVKNDYLDDIIKPSIYFLIGEKGTGKSAYAVFLNNNEYKNNRSLLTYISATDYDKFYTLKKDKHLKLTDFTGIWKVILLLILSKSITENDKVISPFNRSGIEKLISAIDDYYMNAFSPEIITALRIIDETSLAAKLICKYAEVGGSEKSILEFSESRFQMNLFYIERQFTDAIKKLKLNKNINLLLDGIDVRPNNIPYEDYIECIQGLANACWSLNTDLFQNVKDTKGQLKIILLLRPDIFDALNLQNASNKIMDNSVFLDWRTTYNEYTTSSLYKLANRLLAYEQNDIDKNEAWEKYFDWKLRTTNIRKRNHDTAFMEFLRISLSRPRDIIVILQLIQNQMKQEGKYEELTFNYYSYLSDSLQNSYSEYFMSSLKDQLSFYYSAEDYKHFLRFFDFFTDEEFSYEVYFKKYESFVDYILNNAKEIPQFLDTPGIFLQFLYDANIICVIEQMQGTQAYFHFCYREKNKANIAPQVKTGTNCRYRFHYGLYKKTNFGSIHY